MGGISSIFSKPKIPDPPKPAPVVPLPDANDPVAKQQRIQREKETANTKGRASTNLSPSNGAPSYVNKVLGQ